MDVDSLSPRPFAAVGVAALLPVVWYGLARSTTAATVTAVNVAITLAALYVALGPAAGAHGGESAS